LTKDHKNIVALGGIDSRTVLKAKELNFYGVASIGFIWESKKPVKAFQQLVSKIK